MRNIIILIILALSIFSSSSAQDYKPILREDNSWNIFWGQCDVSGVETIFTIKDSISGNKIYATLYSGQITNRIGYLEEDTIQGKVIYNDTLGKSYLVFDISLAPDDTINFVGFYDNQVELIVKDTTTIDDLKYIEFAEDINMCSFNTKFVMIESVGPNVGIHNVSKYSNIAFNNYLLCNYKSSEFYFGNNLFNNECFIDWTGTESKQTSDEVEIIISNNQLSITNYLDQGKLSIYNIHGSLICEKKIHSGSNSITLQDLIPGVYLYLIEIDNETIIDKFTKFKEN